MSSWRISHRLRCSLAFLLLSSYFALSQQNQQVTEPNPYLNTTPATSHTLQPSTQLTDTLTYHAVASYTITLPANQAITIHFLQQKGESGALWMDPQKHPHPIRRNDTGTNSDLRFTLVASEAGQYEIRTLCLTTPADCVLSVTVAAQRPTTPTDSQQAAAEETLAEADTLRRTATTESRTAAQTSYDRAQSINQTTQDQLLTRLILYGKARLALETRQFAHARDLMLEATKLPETKENTAETAACWKLLGYSYAYLGDGEHTLPAYEEALKLYNTNKDALNTEILHENMARIHRTMGENGIALDELTQALNEAQAIHDDRGEVASLEELGNIHLMRGELQDALDAYSQALQSPVISKNPSTQAHVLNGLGNVYTLLGEYDSAQTAFDQSIALWHQIKDPMGESYALDGKGFLAYTRGDYREAVKMHLTALDRIRGVDLDREKAVILEEIAETYQAAGQQKEATDSFAQALAIARKLHLRDIEAACLRGMGEAALSHGNTSAAAANFRLANDLNVATIDRREQALLLADQARLQRSLGHLDQARTDIEAALAVIEGIRSAIRSAQYRSSYFDSQRDYYDFYISLLMQMDRAHPNHGYAALAFNISERARARSLLDTLHENGIEAERGVDPTLIIHERELSNEVDAKLYQLTNADESDATKIREQLHSLQSEYEKIETEIHAKSSGYAALVRGKTISAESLSHDLLDQDTVLLEYWLGKSESDLWVITSSSITSYRLPSRDTLEPRARSLYKSFTVRNIMVAGETADARQTRIQHAETLAQLQSGMLSRMLLRPAATALQRHNTVAILAEGTLASLPFQALPFDGKPLVETHRLVYLPSASILPELRRDRAQSHSQTLAIFADPVFSPNDTRVYGAEKAVQPSKTLATNAQDLTRSASDLGLHEFSRLVYSREEAESISHLLPAQNRWTALGFDANRDAVLNTEWSHYSIVHFSTHAVLDTIHPELSGIVLSLVDPSAKQVDGFLRVRDIYKLHMAADLVVLSACRTALGKEIRGEGVIGLSRAFSYAGSRRVIATLWDVNDRATAVLMENFYRGLLQQGLSPATALAQAQQTVAHTRKWHSPYFWAPFVLVGDWKQ